MPRRLRADKMAAVGPLVDRDGDGDGDPVTVRHWR